MASRDHQQASSPLTTAPTVRYSGGGSNGDFWVAVISLAIIIGLPLLALSFLYDHLGAEVFWHSAKMLFIALILSIIPSLSVPLTENLLLRTLLDVVLFSVFLYGALWLLNISLSGLWIAYTVGIIALLQVGGLFTQINMNYTIHSLKKNHDSHLWEEMLVKVRQIVKCGKILFISIPVVVVIGTVVGMVRASPPDETLNITVLLVTGVVCIELLIISILEFFHMSDPLVHISLPKGINLGRKIDLGCTLTEVRKLFLLDAIHCVILAVGLIAIVLKIYKVTDISMTVLLLSLFVVLSFAFNQVPYITGQFLMRRKLLFGYQGIERAKAMETLEKYAPLFPTTRYMGALTMTGTAGFFLFRILEGLIVEAFGKFNWAW